MLFHMQPKHLAVMRRWATNVGKVQLTENYNIKAEPQNVGRFKYTGDFGINILVEEIDDGFSDKRVPCDATSSQV